MTQTANRQAAPSTGETFRRSKSVWYSNPESVSIANDLLICLVFIVWAAVVTHKLSFTGSPLEGKFEPGKWSAEFVLMFVLGTTLIDIAALAYSGTRARYIDSTGWWDKAGSVARLMVIFGVGLLMIFGVVPKTYNLNVGVIAMFIASLATTGVTMAMWSVVDRSLKMANQQNMPGA